MKLSMFEGLAAGQVSAGLMGMNELAELRKAMEVGYGTDQAALTGLGALRIQSLESTMLSTIQENKHFALFNELVKTNATATVDEWTEQSGVGGFLGGSTNTETGSIDTAQGDYARRVGMVKYLATRREISFVATIQNSQVEAEAVEAGNGALQLLTDAEFLCFEGDSGVVPTEFDGIGTQILSLNDSEHVLDAEGQSLASINLVNSAAAGIAGFGNFGTPTHLFMSQLNQADFDTNLDPAFRVSLNSSGQDLMLGAPVKGIRTSWGDIKTVPDVFIRDEPQQVPFELLYPSVAANNVAFKPQVVSPAAASGGADSKWGASHAGNYYYAVAGINAKGQSGALVSAQVAVSQGDQVALTITASAANTETGYAIYRGRKNGTNALSDLRLVKRIPKTVGGTTTFVDKNRDIPGTVKAHVLNMLPGAQAITWRQFLPMTKFQLFPTVSAVVPWAQLLFGYLRLGKRKHHVVIKNIVPAGSVWKPFG
jgi:hypothetical protein